ncbi:MAG: adenylate kinase, partial [Owenweeksia sp.]
EQFNLIHLSTGDLLRSEIKAGTKLGKEAKVLMDDGKLVPDEIVIGMIRHKLEANPSAAGFIFDGFPRTEKQAEALDELLEEEGTSITMMLALEVDDNELIKRLLERGKDSGRPDDQNEEVIRKRLDVYQAQTSVLKDYYRKQDKFEGIDGLGTIDQVFERLSGSITAAKSS